MPAPALLLRVLTLTSLVVGSVLTAVPAQAATAPYGPDVSSWQHPSGAAIDWAKVKAGGSTFAIVKATEGAGYTNPYYAGDVKAARAAHLVVGAYSYVRPALPISTAADQAKQFATAIGGQATAGTLPPILDLETTGGLSRGDLITWTQSFLETVRAQTGRTPIVYSYPYFWSTSMAGTTAFARYPLWLASYSSTAPAPLPGWSSWTLWQYTSTGTVPGIAGTGAVDLSHFNGTPAQLTALADGTVHTAWTVQAPAAPVGLVGAPALKAVALSWRPADDGGQLPSSYTVTASPGGAHVTVAGTATRATVGGLTPGTAYRFTVRATNSAGASPASALSAAVVPGDVPSVPTNLTASLGVGTVTLAWTASTGGPTSYAVSRCSPSPCTPTATTATVTGTTWTDHPLVNGLVDSYAVRAVNRFGASANSTVVSVVPVVLPPAPAPLLATTGPASVRLAWTTPASTRASQYVVVVDDAKPVTVPGAITTFLATGLAPATHAFTVRAVNAVGTGPAATVHAVAAPPLSRLTLSLPTTAAVSGKTLTISVTARRTDTGAVLVGVPVLVSYLPRAGAAPTPVRAVTNASGVATATVPVSVSGTVRAVLSGTAAIQGSTITALAAVRPVLAAALSATTFQVGRTVVLSGATNRLLAGERVYRQDYYGGAWHTVTSAVVDATGYLHFVITPPLGRDHYRLWVAATSLHTAGTSLTVSILVTR